jgi:hypothetical protein
LLRPSSSLSQFEVSGSTYTYKCINIKIHEIRYVFTTVQYSTSIVPKYSFTTEELNQRNSGKPYISDWRTGLTLAVPKWNKNPPLVIGNWVRIFPFDSETEKMSEAGAGLEVKETTRHVRLHRELLLGIDSQMVF